eukprot:NODE_10141_length_1374_cov_3.251002.p4 GENE.NODE_10141_length_1374_cov_3.251002~~NODE_10141_length_1374_cov_3.251002.p4  ORF type:complete len:176 (+),score=40.50 NODE_10141_length_1374_cov_3.251002:321-848(+)
MCALRNPQSGRLETDSSIAPMLVYVLLIAERSRTSPWLLSDAAPPPTMPMRRVPSALAERRPLSDAAAERGAERAAVRAPEHDAGVARSRGDATAATAPVRGCDREERDADPAEEAEGSGRGGGTSDTVGAASRPLSNSSIRGGVGSLPFREAGDPPEMSSSMERSSSMEASRSP